MRVELSLGLGHRDQPTLVCDYVQIYTVDAADTNINLAKIAIPLLKCLKRFRQGVPREFNSLHDEQMSGQILFEFVGTDEERDRALEIGMEKWHAAVDEMIWAFEQHQSMTGEETSERAMAGLKLFAELYHTLWN